MSKEIKKSDQKEYRSIFKATSLFGGVQVFQILIKVIKSKFIAVLLGPEGVGILGLLTSATDLIKSLTSMGLSQSAVRDVSEANGSNDRERINRTVSVVRRLVWITGLLGVFVVVVMSPLLSTWSFGDNKYTISFIILSITLLLDQLCAGQKVVLQGMRRLKDLAKASVLGATVGLLVSVPLYFLYGKDGIVPTLVISSICALIISWYFSKKIHIKKITLPTKDYLKYGKQMLGMGLAMSLSSILGHAVSYIIRGFIRSNGSLDDVGMYQAGYAILTTYVGLVFSAIITDYYPRLAAVNKNNDKCRETVCQQGDITVMIMGPMLCVCLIIMPYLIRILYSEKFLYATSFVMWGCLGMMFKLASWLISFMFVAKAERNLFMVNEILANAYILTFSLIGYYLWGVEGLGIAFLVNYFVYFLQVFLIAKKRYGFGFTKSFSKNYLIMLLMVVSIFLLLLFLNGIIKYVIVSIIAVLSVVFSLHTLTTKMNFSLINKIRSKL